MEGILFFPGYMGLSAHCGFVFFGKT